MFRMVAGARKFGVIIIATIFELLIHPYLRCIIPVNRQIFYFLKKANTWLIFRFLIFLIGQWRQDRCLLIRSETYERLSVKLESPSVQPG